MKTRNDAPLLLVLTLAILAPSRLAAESSMLYGKQALWETWEIAGLPAATPGTSSAPTVIAQSLETPNQIRRRLGLPVESSFPAPEFGVSEETPNQRRQRLNLVKAVSLP